MSRADIKKKRAELAAEEDAESEARDRELLRAREAANMTAELLLNAENALANEQEAHLKAERQARISAEKLAVAERSQREAAEKREQEALNAQDKAERAIAVAEASAKRSAELHATERNARIALESRLDALASQVARIASAPVAKPVDISKLRLIVTDRNGGGDITEVRPVFDTQH